MIPGVGRLWRGPSHYATLALDSKIAPACAYNFEMRPAGGSLPVSGAESPELLMWVRHLDAQGVDPAVALIALADSLPPAAMTCFTEPAAISSASWMIDLPQLSRCRRMVSCELFQPAGAGRVLATGHGNMGRKRPSCALGAPDSGDFYLIQTTQAAPPEFQSKSPNNEKNNIQGPRGPRRCARHFSCACKRFCPE